MANIQGLWALNEHKNGQNWPKTAQNEHFTISGYIFYIFVNAQILLLHCYKDANVIYILANNCILWALIEHKMAKIGQKLRKTSILPFSNVSPKFVIIWGLLAVLSFRTIWGPFPGFSGAPSFHDCSVSCFMIEWFSYSVSFLYSWKNDSKIHLFRVRARNRNANARTFLQFQNWFFFLSFFSLPFFSFFFFFLSFLHPSIPPPPRCRPRDGWANIRTYDWNERPCVMRWEGFSPVGADAPSPPSYQTF